MSLFAVAALTPVALIALSALIGGVWPWLAVSYVTALVFTLDHVIARTVQNPPKDAEFPAARPLLVLLGLAHLGLVPLVIWAVAGDSGLSGGARALTALAAALFFGQVSHPTAHELIHQPARYMRLLGRLVYSTILFGHHASAHLRIHHVHVGTADDPNTARRGLGFYRYFARSWKGSLIQGLKAESALMRRGNKPLWHHPYLLYAGVAAGLLIWASWAFGLAGLGTALFLGIYAQIQILMSDYVQHYGLERRIDANGRREPVGPQHSWNAPHWYSSAMTLNAPRHSDHHVVPNRPYPALQLDNTMPTLPNSLPVMAVLALWPAKWRQVMDPLVDQWASKPREGA